MASTIRRHLKSPLGLLVCMACGVFLFGYALGGFIGNWLVQMGMPSTGISVYRVALRIYPWNAAGHNDLGVILFHNGDTSGAVDALRRAVALEPDDAEMRHHLGFALFKDGQLGEAVREFEEAVRLAPEHEEYRQDLEMAILVRGTKRR